MSTDDTSSDGSKGGDVASLTLRILGQIRDQARDTNLQLRDTNLQLRELRRATTHGFAEVNRRIDNVLLGTHREEHQELRRRVERLEHRVGIDEPIGVEGGPPR